MPAAQRVLGQGSQPGVVWPWDGRAGWESGLCWGWGRAVHRGLNLGQHPPSSARSQRAGPRHSVELPQEAASWAGCRVGGDHSCPGWLWTDHLPPCLCPLHLLSGWLSVRPCHPGLRGHSHVGRPAGPAGAGEKRVDSVWWWQGRPPGGSDILLSLKQLVGRREPGMPGAGPQIRGGGSWGARMCLVGCGRSEFQKDPACLVT